MIAAAAWAGADAFKICLYLPEHMAPQSDDPAFQITDGLWKGQSLYQLYCKTFIPPEWTPQIAKAVHAAGMVFVASVFDPEYAPLAVEWGVDVLKIASFEVGWENLRKSVHDCDCPAIISTGTATQEELDAVVAEFKGKEMCLLKCTSQYPAPFEAMNLATLVDMRQRYHVPVGLSDHSGGMVCPVVAATLGAAMIEKHFKIDEDGFDVAFSLDPQAFRAMVMTVRAATASLGTVDYQPTSTQYRRQEVNGRWIRTVQQPSQS